MMSHSRSGPEPVSDPEYASHLGARLRTIREQRGWSLRDVQVASKGRFTGSAVGTYERGERGISVQRLSELAQLYGVPVERLLPDNPIRDEGRGSGRQETEPARDKVVIELAALERQEESEFGPMRRYIDTIKFKRGDYNGRVLSVRTSDVWAMAAMASVDPDSLVHTLESLEILRPSPS